MKRCKDVEKFKLMQRRALIGAQITKNTKQARDHVPKPWHISLMDHLFDRMVDRCSTDSDIVNVAVLINRALRYKLCEIVYAFALGHMRVILVHGKYHLGLTQHHSDRGVFVQFRTIMIEENGLKTRQRAYHILVD